MNFVWTGGPVAQPMFSLSGGSFPSNPSYLEFRGLNLDGHNNEATDGFMCKGSHHLRFIGNTINNMGASGIASIECDYLTSDHNVVNHSGYIPAGAANPQWYSWTSGISYNSSQWFDSYPGFHNIISNNIIAGQYDNSPKHTDGNGIILDLSNRTYDPASANTPPALIVNNVVYGNGGRCIETYLVTNFWIVNNTCYKNVLDAALGNSGSVSTSDSRDGYFINNISVAWHSNSPSYEQTHTNANVQYFANMYYGALNNFEYSDPSQFIQADPLFVKPPYFDPTASGQYATALPPSQLGNGLTLLPASPALRKGVDPTTVANSPAAIVADLRRYIYTDINGKLRPRGSWFDLGAYQLSSASSDAKPR